MLTTRAKFLLELLFVLNVQTSFPCPVNSMGNEKAAYKSGEIQDQTQPITLFKIKAKLKESGIFDEDTAKLDDREKKELKKLYDTIEIMTTSRNRQPQNVQNMFSSLRLVERVIKKQVKESQISETLAAKFHWEKLSGRQRRDEPAYYLNKTTNMRTFNVNIEKAKSLIHIRDH